MRFIKIEIVKHVYNRANAPMAFGEVCKDMLACFKAEKEKDPRAKMAEIVEGVIRKDAEEEKKRLENQD